MSAKPGSVPHVSSQRGGVTTVDSSNPGVGNNSTQGTQSV